MRATPDVPDESRSIGRLSQWEEAERIHDRRTLPPSFLTRVVGLTFVSDYPTNLHFLAALLIERNSNLKVELVHNPDNPYDANAIEVHVEQIGMVGHVKRRVAAVLAADLDQWIAQVGNVLIHEEHPTQPGLSIVITRKQ
jgi:hypothetical protein